MAITRMQMKRQLYANGGIMDVTPRENFGLGSSLKKFVSKIIPNEVADIAVKAAPFVAPFNPALAAGMSGLGTFDQTGSIGSGLRSGAMNYAIGQGSRYLGGADFQGNPFSSTGGFTPGTQGSGTFSKYFSKPTGSGGIKNLFKDNPAQGIQPISGNEMGSQFTEPTFGAGDVLGGEMGTTGAGTVSGSTTGSNSFTEKAFDLLKKGTKAAFYDSETGKLDKAAVLGAATFAASYAEALVLANNAGVDLTEEEYDEAQRAEKKAEYAGYLTNFFGGKKDGGRIGYEGGANELIMEKLKEDIMPDTSTEDMIMIMTEAGPKMIKRSVYESMSGMFRDTTTGFGANINRIEEANGGRIGRKFGSPEEGEKSGVMEMLAVDVDAGGDDEEDMLMAYTPGFSSQEKSYLFRRMGASGGAERSYTMPQLYRILKNPADYPEDAAVLKEIAVMGLGKKDGGRIGFKDGTDKSMLEKLLNSKIAQEGRYGASEFFFGDPIMFGTPDKFKDGKNDNRGTFKRDPSDYDKLSPEKQAYIEAFLNSDEGQLFLKPGKIKFPTNEKMREHNEKITLEDFNEDRNPLELLLGIDYENRAKGGRIGYKGGANRVSELLILRDELVGKGEDVSDIEAEIFQLTGKTFKSVGGISEIPTGEPRLNAGGVAERDYRQTGGFVPVGIKERADDVPAMLSKNEFVMTADAVRGIGNGSVEEGSKKLYNTMKQAEKVGKA